MRFVCLISLILLCGCQSTVPTQETDRTLFAEDLSFSELPEEQVADLEIEELPIPQAMFTKVSATITPGSPLKEILIDLAAQANVSVALGGDVSGSVSLSCQDQPFIDVITHICELAQLRYKVHLGTLVIERDEPYVKTYHVPSLNFTRSTQNRIAVNTDLLNTNGSSRTASAENSGTHVISGKAESDFWAELKQNLEHLLYTAPTPTSPLMGMPSYAFHKQGGLVTITATDHHHRMVKDYFETLEKTTSAQVLIEAKIIEVNLKNEFHSGINWQTLSANLNTSGQLGTLAPHLNPPGSLPDFTSKNNIPLMTLKRGASLKGAISLIEQFGKTRTLSSPRITVLNNHSAVMKVAENSVYFRLKYTRYMRSKEEGNDVVFASSDIETVPIGLILTVQPSINTQKGEITLALRPTITSTSRQINDPAVDIQSKNEVHSPVPIVQVREVDSVLHLSNGEITVLGGLMQERHHEGGQGLPGMRHIPVVGKALGGNDVDHDVVELVIFLKATILKSPSQRAFTQERKLS